MSSRHHLRMRPRSQNSSTSVRGDHSSRSILSHPALRLPITGNPHSSPRPGHLSSCLTISTICHPDCFRPDGHSSDHIPDHKCLKLIRGECGPPGRADSTGGSHLLCNVWPLGSRKRLSSHSSVRPAHPTSLCW